MVPPWEVPFVLDALRDEIAGRTRRELRITTGGSALLILAFWVLTPPVLALMLTVVAGVLLALLIASVRRRVRQAERLSAACRRAFSRGC
ncbi:MAG TPA: hypothetical protein VE871_20910 [Longimicrobium sp.]|nr:hypothetical protein [Longimicrobium sp.]